MPLVAGVDSSTQSTKVELRDAASGELVAVGRGAHPATTPPRSEQPPQAWAAALGEALAQCGAAVAEVAAISVAGQQHGLVTLDALDEVVRPAKLWNDTESAPEAEALVARFGGAQAWAAAVGSVPVAAFTVTKLAWLANHEPAAFARVARVGLPHDYLNWRLCGRWVTDRGDASGSGWYSPAEGRYRDDVLELIAADRAWLPEVLGPLDVAGETPAVFGLPAGVIVGPGTGDNMGAALGLGLGPGDVVVSVGTSGTAYAVSSVATADPSGAVAGFADATGRYLPLVCTLNATKVTDVVARLLGVDHAAFDRLALAAPAGAGGLTLVPYFDGERTPNRPHATGLLAGLRSDVSREDVARAAVEGVICGLLDGVDALVAAGVDVAGRLYLVGGGARSAAYRQVLADLTGREVTVPHEDEVVAAGACVQAAAVLSQRPPAEIAAAWGLGVGDTVAPNAAADHGAVRAAYAAARG